jgi:predicted amidohydrolase
MERYLITLITIVTILFPTTVFAKKGKKMAKSIQVASLSIVPEKWDKSMNIRKTEMMVRDAAKAGATIIVTPEGVIDGYVINEIIREKDKERKQELISDFNELAEPMNGSVVGNFRQICREYKVFLVLCFLEKKGNKLYNTAALIGPSGKVIGKYSKTHFHQGYKVNPPGYTPGNKYPVFNLGFIKLGIMICFDRQVPEVARELALAGADLIVCPAYGSIDAWNTHLMMTRAYENQVFMTFTHPQKSFIFDRDGKIFEQCGPDQTIMVEILLSKMRKTRPSIVHRRPDTYRRLSRGKKK